MTGCLTILLLLVVLGLTATIKAVGCFVVAAAILLPLKLAWKVRAANRAADVLAAASDEEGA